FFFSSRRRHTRCLSDWSSDVCSSDLLSWKNLRIGGERGGPATDVPAWLAPRRVPDASSVTTAAGETERYLFYRGVGHIDAPLSRSEERRVGKECTPRWSPDH